MIKKENKQQLFVKPCGEPNEQKSIESLSTQENGPAEASTPATPAATSADDVASDNTCSQLGAKSANSGERQYKKFDFFYRRTVFRNMNEYYKDLFNPILKKFKGGDRSSVLQQTAQDEGASSDKAKEATDIT